MTKKRNASNWDMPLLHPDHPRPVTRRQFLSQGFMTGAAYTVGGIAPLLGSRHAFADLAPDLNLLKAPDQCNITNGGGKIPFMCFDLAGGANIANSNVLVGQQGGQTDFLSTQGYEKMGLPGDMVPGLVDPDGGGDYANFDLGLGFHLDSAFRRGIMSMISPETAANINGAVIPARSDNDTGNNPHNPMYGIALAGADGNILTLAGSENTDSGGNSTLPAALFDPELRPTKVDRPSDVVNLVDTGDLVGILTKDDATKVMESIYRLSDQKMFNVETLVNRDADIDKAVRCGYLKAAHIADEFGGTPIDPGQDPIIVDDVDGIFTTAEFTAGDRSAREFQKTASVMKLVMNGYAGAGCVEMGGYDYHGGRRAEGEVKDFRAGRCMGAALEYAARLGKPLMLYVFSDGSLSSNGALDMTDNGRGKGEWTSDNSSTAGSFFLVYNPNGRPQLRGANLDEQLRHQQIGYMTADGSVQRAATPMANNVNLLVNAVVLNYMALHDEVGLFEGLYQSLGISHGLGNDLDQYIAFQNIVSGTVPA